MESTKPIQAESKLIQNSTTGLGLETGHFPLRKRALKSWICAIGGSLLIVLAILLLIFFSLETITKIQNHGRAIIINQLPYFIIALGLMLPAGILLIFLARVFHRQGITTHEKGLLISTGIQKHRLDYQNIQILNTRIVEVIFGNSIISERLKITLVDQNENKWLIRNKYDQMMTCIEQIRQHLLPILYQKAIAKQSCGETLSFGNEISLTPNELRIKHTNLLWTDLSSYVVKNGYLCLNSRNPDMIIPRININKIENMDLLIYIIENYLAEHVNPHLNKTTSAVNAEPDQYTARG